MQLYSESVIFSSLSYSFLLIAFYVRHSHSQRVFAIQWLHVLSRLLYNITFLLIQYNTLYKWSLWPNRNGAEPADDCIQWENSAWHNFLIRAIFFFAHTNRMTQVQKMSVVTHNSTIDVQLCTCKNVRVKMRCSFIFGSCARKSELTVNIRRKLCEAFIVVRFDSLVVLSYMYYITLLSIFQMSSVYKTWKSFSRIWKNIFHKNAIVEEKVNRSSGENNDNVYTVNAYSTIDHFHPTFE